MCKRAFQGAVFSESLVGLVSRENFPISMGALEGERGPSLGPWLNNMENASSDKHEIILNR